MAASVSLKDLLKSIGSTFADPQLGPDLPTSIEESIQSLIHSDAAIDEAASNRLHEDLQSIHKKHVARHDSKIAAFLQLLLLLRSRLLFPHQKLHWYKLLVFPVLDNVGRLRVEIDRASQLMLAILDYDGEEDDAIPRAKESAQFVRALLDGYMARTLDCTTDDNEYSLENEHIASHFEHVLISYGKKKPKDLMLALDALLVDRQRRIRALVLLTVIVRYQPPHLHHVAQTPLIEHLLQSLLIDTSTTVIQLALTALVMFLPHIPTTVKRHLPRLFLIYSRLLCFDKVSKLSVGAEEETEDVDDKNDEVSADHAAWQKLFASEGEELIPINMIHFFTFLYGLYPLNFTSFIRRPRRYLKDIQFPRAEQLDLDQDLIRIRTAPFREKHLLHENFYNITAEEELEDDHFLQKDASDVVASCIGLVNNVPSSLDRSTSSASIALDNKPQQDTESKDVPADSLLAADDASTLAESTVSTSDSLPLLGGRRSLGSHSDHLSRRLSPQSLDSPANQTSQMSFKTPLDDKQGLLLTEAALWQDLILSEDPKTALLQRNVLLLRNDLQYERYLKAQHLSHIGQLQRRHVMDATLMATLENQMALNKTLKSKLAKSTDAYAALKKETSTGRAQSKEFELKLTSRVRALRDAENEWARERAELKVQLDRSSSDNAALRKLVVEAESRELLSQQEKTSSKFELERARETHQRLSELEQSVKERDAKAWDDQAAAVKYHDAVMEVETLKMQLQSQQARTETMQDSFSAQIRDLKARLESAGIAEARDAEVADRVHKANRALSARFVALQDEHAALRRKQARFGHVDGGTFVRGSNESRRQLDGRDDSNSNASTSSDSRDVSPGQQTLPQMTPQAAGVPSSASVRPGVGGKSFMQRMNEGRGGFDDGNSRSLYQQRLAAQSAESLDKSGSSSARRVGVMPKEGEGKKKKARSSGIRGIRGFM